MLIQDGKIRYTGTLSEAEKLEPQAKRLNLNNKIVIPGIIDAHSHLNSVGMQQTVANLYPPPDGKVVSIATLIQEMKAWAKQNPTFVQATSGWIIGNGYDDAQLQEKTHPTATDLDQISTTQRPQVWRAPTSVVWWGRSIKNVWGLAQRLRYKREHGITRISSQDRASCHL